MTGMSPKRIKRVPVIFFRTEAGGEPVREWLNGSAFRGRSQTNRRKHQDRGVRLAGRNAALPPPGKGACRRSGIGPAQYEEAPKGDAMKQKPSKSFDHSGSTFDSFLEEEGIREEVEAVALKRVLAWQLQQAMKKQRKTKKSMAEQLGTSRSQLDRLLDPRNVSVSLETITRAAGVLGKRVVIQLRDGDVNVGRKVA